MNKNDMKYIILFITLFFSSALTAQYVCEKCAEAELDPQCAGGTPPIGHNWSNGATSPTITVTQSGAYSVTCTDSSNPPCTFVQEFDVTIIEEPDKTCQIRLSGPVLAQTCDTTVCVDAHTFFRFETLPAGLNGFTYSWTTSWGATGSSWISPTGNIASLGVGTHTAQVTITDPNGICPPQVLDFSITLEDCCAIVCNPECLKDGVVDVDCTGCEGDNYEIDAGCTGGVAPLSYTWSDGFTINPRPVLLGGTYAFTVTDATGNCSTNGSIDVVINPPPTAVCDATDANCGQSNGSASVTASGGTPSYTYEWSNGVTDPNNPNLAAGTYTVTVTDANGCTTTCDAIVGNTDGPTAVCDKIDPTCQQANGEASVTVTGGATPYTYSWSNGGNTATITGLTAGTYTVTVTDADGCETTCSVTLEDDDPLTSNPICN